MMYEFRVCRIAEEFGVHRNTVRNWIKTGFIPARKGPGRKYLMKLEDYQALCEKFCREPNVYPANNISGNPTTALRRSTRPLPVLSGVKSRHFHDPFLAGVCRSCGSCAELCPISGVDGIDPRKIVLMAALGLDDQLVQADWPWQCTMCSKCEEACPAGIEIVALIRKIRGASKRAEFPGRVHRE